VTQKRSGTFESWMNVLQVIFFLTIYRSGRLLAFVLRGQAFKPSEVCVDVSRRYPIKSGPPKRCHITSVEATHLHYCWLLRALSDQATCRQKNWCYSSNYSIQPMYLSITDPFPIPESLHLVIYSFRLRNWANIVTFAISKPVTC
jgi:hypothetical protein